MSGDVLVVTSGKGGVGKTTTVVNLAIALRQHGHSVAVLDADLGMPDVGEFLSIDAKPTLHDVLAGRADITEATVEIGDGLAFVFGDTSLEGFAQADPAKLEAVISDLTDEYQCVLVDTGGGLTYETVFPMDLGDAVLLVTSPVPAAIADTKKSKQVAERLGVPACGVVVTHADGDAHPESVASELDVDFLGSVPDDEAIVESAAKRQPVVAYAPESAATVAYYRLAERIADEETAALEPLDTAAKTPEEVFESATDITDVDDSDDATESEADGEADAEPDTEAERDESGDKAEPRDAEGDGAGEADSEAVVGESEDEAEDTEGDSRTEADDGKRHGVDDTSDADGEKSADDEPTTEAKTPAEMAGGIDEPEPGLHAGGTDDADASEEGARSGRDDTETEDGSKDDEGFFDRLLSRFR